MSETRNVFLHQIIKNSLATYLSYKWSKNNLYLKKRSKLSQDSSNVGNISKSCKKVNKKHSIINLENDVFIFNAKTNTFTQLDLAECFRNSVYYKNVDPFSENCHKEVLKTEYEISPLEFNKCDTFPEKLQKVLNEHIDMDEWSNEAAYSDTFDIFIQKEVNNKNVNIKTFTKIEQDKNSNSINNICSSSVGYYAITSYDSKYKSSSDKNKRSRHSKFCDLIGIHKRTKKSYHKSLQVTLSSSSSRINKKSRNNFFDENKTLEKGIQCAKYKKECKKSMASNHQIKDRTKFDSSGELQNLLKNKSFSSSCIKKPYSSKINEDYCEKILENVGIPVYKSVLHNKEMYNNKCGLNSEPKDESTDVCCKNYESNYNEIQNVKSHLLSDKQAQYICDILTSLKEKIKAQTEEQNRNLDHIMEELTKQAAEIQEIRETLNRRKKRKSEKNALEQTKTVVDPKREYHGKDNQKTPPITEERIEPEIIELYGKDKKCKCPLSKPSLFKKASWKSLWNFNEVKTFFVMDRSKRSQSKLQPTLSKKVQSEQNPTDGVKIDKAIEARSKPWLPNFLNPRRILKSKAKIDS